MNISKNLAVAIASSALMLSPAAFAQDKMDHSKMSDTAKGSMKAGADSHFVMEAASGGMTEVQLGKLAQDKGSNSDVKAFGQKMVDDHTKAGDELKQIASQKGYTVPSEMNAKDKATVDRLSALSGDAFDKAYVKNMLVDHKKDVAAFQKEANSGKDPEIKSFASKTLPTLQEHLKMVQDLNSKMGSAKSMSKSTE